MESNSLQPIVLSSMAERTKFPAPGFAGGLGDVRIDGKKVDHRGQHVLEYGDHVLVSMSGGGGYRPASARPRTFRPRDRLLGYAGRRG
jgi:N-methylhydantoinase B/oxoprolinase/acetone carboxylase alpha subunit